LSNEGVKKFLSKISNEKWKNQRQFFDYLNQVETKHIETIESFLSNNHNVLLLEQLNQFQFTERNSNFNLNKFHKTMNFFKGKTNLLKKLGIESLHPNLPFLKEKTGGFVKWNNYSRNIFSHLCPEEREAIRQHNDMWIKKILGQDIIRNFVVMSPVEVQKLNNIAAENGKLINPNDSVEFLD
jgi:hypothetical protein